MPIRLDERAVKETPGPARARSSYGTTRRPASACRFRADVASSEGRPVVLHQLPRQRRRTSTDHRGLPSLVGNAARDEAKALRKRIDKGEDPALARREAREAPTVKDLAERYKSSTSHTRPSSRKLTTWR